MNWMSVSKPAEGSTEMDKRIVCGATNTMAWITESRSYSPTEWTSDSGVIELTTDPDCSISKVITRDMSEYRQEVTTEEVAAA